MEGSIDMENVVIVEACRTAVGKMGGALRPLKAVDMAASVIGGVLRRSNISKDAIDEVIIGQCRQSSDDPNIARIASLREGISEAASAHTVMRQCASGMTAVHNGAMQIICGISDVVIAGGVESMSNGIFYIRDGRYGLGTGNTELVDSIVESQFRAQPQEMYGIFNMGMTAENIAEQMGITREEQDEFAIESQRRAIAAIDGGLFKEEIIPVSVPQGGKNPSIIFDIDEFPRRDSSMDKLGRLKPVFRTDGRGSVTAGNSSGRNDGASAMLMMSESKAVQLGYKPIARIIGMGTAGCDPRTMGLGPVYAVPKALKSAGITMEDIQLIELNEAFAAQSIGCIKKLGWEDKKEIINVNGGAIALGHPVGSSGCRIIITLMYEMRRRNLKYGLATLCIAGGMGQATVIEML